MTPIWSTYLMRFHVGFLLAKEPCCGALSRVTVLPSGGVLALRGQDSWRLGMPRDRRLAVLRALRHERLQGNITTGWID